MTVTTGGTVASASGNEQSNFSKKKTIIRAVCVCMVTKEKWHKKAPGNDTESECEKCEEQVWESEELSEELGLEREAIVVEKFCVGDGVKKS